MNSNPKISIVGTPIGNLGDLSNRAIETLKKSDVIFAEDTRTATSLLNFIGIKKRIISCHKDNEKAVVTKIINESVTGNHIAIVSEAGMPCISDPGSEVIKTLLHENIPFEIISGPTALIHGLIASGFSGGPFLFYGFLPHKSSEKKKILENIKKIAFPIVFYESPHRVKDTLKLLLEYFAPPIACCRELTKLYEETVFIKTKEDLDNITVKGEFVIVVNNLQEDNKETQGTINIQEMSQKLSKEGFTAQEIVKILKAFGIKRNDVYKAILDNNQQ